jgi:hypothetical protein
MWCVAVTVASLGVGTLVDDDAGSLLAQPLHCRSDHERFSPYHEPD